MSATILKTLEGAEIGQAARITLSLNKGGEAGLARLHEMSATGKVLLPDMDVFVLTMVLGNVSEYFCDNRTYTITFTNEAARREFLQSIGGDLESAEVVNSD